MNICDVRSIKNLITKRDWYLDLHNSNKLNGIGITKKDDNWQIVILLKEHIDGLPNTQDGLDVVYKIVGNITTNER